MPKFEPLQYEKYANKTWKTPGNYAFAANDILCPIAAQELAKIISLYPTGFVKTKDGFKFVAVLGLQGVGNLFVSPAGAWQAEYIPAGLRAHPFRMMKDTKGQHILCFDTESALLSDSKEHNGFFTDDREPSEALSKFIPFLTSFTTSRIKTDASCQVLAQYGLLEPWNLSLKKEENPDRIEGLYKIDQAAFNSLDGDALRTLRDSNSLQLVYAQLQAKAQLPRLGTKYLSRQESSKELPKELNLDFLVDDGNISFDEI